MKSLSLLILCFALVYSGDKAKADDESDDQAFAADFHQDQITPQASFYTYALQAVNQISGVYRGYADIYYDWFQSSPFVPIKIFVNHNGKDHDKKLIVRVERVIEPWAHEKKVEKDQGFVCSLYQDFTLHRRSFGLVAVKSKNIEMAGQLGDVNIVKILMKKSKNFSSGFGFGLSMECSDRWICSDDDFAHHIVQIPEETPSFEDLHSSCFEK